MKQMEDFLFNTIGEKSILTTEQIVAFMANAKIDIDCNNIEYFIDFLCALSFLGREVRPNVFNYEYDLETDIKIKILSDKLGGSRYKIHKAFIPFLECSDYEYL